MAKRVKEEEKMERTIRNLLKLPGNRRCINCNSLGPQYVCTTFLTFVCTNCSGVHREFTHRVKSVSMAKFTADEVTALQASGNERARQIYLKTWDPQRHFFPDSSNLQRLRDFIKHVYVDRKYTGEKSVNELPRLRLNDKDSDSPQERRKASPYHSGLQNLQGESSGSRARKDHKGSIYFYDERSSPRFSKENSRYGGFGKSVACIEVVDNRIRDDRHGNRKLSSKEPKSSSQLSESEEALEKSSSAVSRKGVREDVIESKGVDAGGCDQDQNLHRVGPGETKSQNLESLIDFSIDSALSDATATPQTQQIPSSVPAAPSANTLEALLFELSAPSTEVVSIMNDGARNDAAAARSGGPDLITGHTPPNSLEISVAGPTEIVSFEASDGNLQLTSNMSGDTASRNINQQLPNMQQNHMGDPFANTGLDLQLVTAAVAPNFEPWASSSEPNAQGSSSVSITDADSKPAQGIATGIGSQPPSSEVNSGRKEIPADLFTMQYPSFPTPNPGWQSGTHQVMGYNLQYYPNSVTTMDYANSARPTNPFDIDDGKNGLHSQSAFTGVPASIHTSGYLAQHTGGTYAGQQMYGNPPSLRTQGVGNYGSNAAAAFGAVNTTQQPSGEYPAPNAGPVSSTYGNNPFG